MTKFTSTILKGAALLSVGQVAGYGFSFVRNLILARLLTKADFGLAAALSVTMSLLELVSRMAFGRQVVQSPEGDTPLFQAVAHSAQATIGVLSAVLVVAGAYPMAHVFGVPDLVWAFAMLALVPLFRGLMHLDVARVQRHFNYAPWVWCDAVPQGLAAIAAWPLAVWLQDYRAVLWILVGKELSTLAMSHLMAHRPYRWAWNSRLLKLMLAFGWPLMLNGFVMFASQQGDQMVIGATFSLADLGSYSIAFTLTSIPFFILGQVGSSLMLPMLSRHQDQAEQFEHHYCRCLEIAVFGALAVLGPLVVAGETIVRILYGAKYAGVGVLMAIFGVMVALRFFRWTPATAAMSLADTLTLLYGNIARAVSLPIALAIVAWGTGSMEAVAACGLLGEISAIVISVLRIRKRQGIRLAVHARPVFFLIMWIIISVTFQFLQGDGASIWLAGAYVIALWGIGAAAAFFLFPELIALLRRTAADFHIGAILHSSADSDD